MILLTLYDELKIGRIICIKNTDHSEKDNFGFNLVNRDLSICRLCNRNEFCK